MRVLLAEDEKLLAKRVKYVLEKNNIYEITGAELAEILTASYSDLRHDDIFTSDGEDVYKMEVELDGKNYTLEMTERTLM